MYCFIWIHEVPEKGVLYITTEFGKIMVPPNEICVIQVGQILEIINNKLIKCKKYLLLCYYAIITQIRKQFFYTKNGFFEEIFSWI